VLAERLVEVAVDGWKVERHFGLLLRELGHDARGRGEGRVLVGQEGRGMQQRAERERLRMVQNRRVLLEGVELRKVRGRRVMVLHVVVVVGLRVHRHRIEAVMVVVMRLMVSELIVQVLQLRLPGTALVLNS
jgi:hypothetical protein